MAINYTTLLGLAQPVTGTEANTWGDAVNTQITALLDSAIAGAATISVTAGNVTLTDLDGAADQARMAILILTGTPGTTRNVVAPSRSKTYIVINQSDASAVIKGSATAGVTVRAGQAATCVWSGADFEIVASGDVDGPASATNNAIPTFDGTTGKIIKDNSGATISAGVITATGFAGPLNGSVGATTPSTVVATQVDITAQGDLRLQDTTGGQFVALQAPGTIATSYTLTLPVDDGTSGQALITDGSGVLSWSSAASGDVYGPASATDNAVARYDGTTGKIIQNSAVTIADDGATVIAANSTSDGLRITQVGTGNALLVEDSANPDATPFVVSADGLVLQGSTSSITTPNYGGTASGFLLQTNGTGSSGVGYVGHELGIFNNSTAGAGIFAVKSRNGTVGSHTIVNSGDKLFAITAAGSDGANFIRAADISYEVDGTPGTNDMPGRLVFSTTADGASSPTERMRIDSAGQIGFGNSPIAGSSLAVRKNITGDPVSYGVLSFAAIQSDVTNTASMFQTLPSTAATAFTLGSLNHYYANQSTIGAGSTVTNQFGFRAESSLTGATNNYGFYSNIASGTGRWNFYAAGTAANVFAGTTHIGGAVGAESLRVTPVASAVNYFEVQGAITSSVPIFRATGSDTNVPMTILSKGTGYFNFQSGGGTQFFVGHTASAVNYLQVTGGPSGFGPEISTQGASANLDLYLKTKGSGGYIFYTNSAVQQFVVAHTASAVNYLQVRGEATGARPILEATGSDANVGIYLGTKGTGTYEFHTGGARQFSISNVTSAVNYLQVTGGATGNAATLSAAGSDTNIDLALTPKGTGRVRFGTLTANADAPITGYIEVKDSAGNVRKLAVIA